MSQDTKLVVELLEKLDTIDNEMTLLREDRKETLDDYKEKLDLKVFRAAMRILKIRQKTDNNFAIDEMLDTMGDSDGN